MVWKKHVGEPSQVLPDQEKDLLESIRGQLQKQVHGPHLSLTRSGSYARVKGPTPFDFSLLAAQREPYLQRFPCIQLFCPI